MQLILLSGGSGKRLWPLSNDARSKQFLKLLKRPGGKVESMAQRVFGQIENAGLKECITISTNALQQDSFIAQIGAEVPIIAEPARRDTFAAIVLACSQLLTVKKCSLDESVVVIPCDQYVDDSYFEIIKKIGRHVEISDADLTLMGIQPTSPSTKYGYIIPGEEISDGIFKVMEFKEKPTETVARAYISQNAFWNGGVFGFKLGYILEFAKKYLPSTDFKYVFDHFIDLPKISFDYEVVEKTDNIDVIRYRGKWEDLGTWASLAAEIDSEIIGNGILTSTCSNTQIINEHNLPVICSGLKDVVVVSSYDGILVASKNDTDNLKPFIEKMTTRPLYEERRWGIYKVLDTQQFPNGMSQLTKQIVLSEGKFISYQLHHHRKEIWTIVNGRGIFVLDNEVKDVFPGDVLIIPAEHKHTIKAMTPLTFIEVQIGDVLAETDIERFDWNWTKM